MYDFWLAAHPEPAPADSVEHGASSAAPLGVGDPHALLPPASPASRSSDEDTLPRPQPRIHKIDHNNRADVNSPVPRVIRRYALLSDAEARRLQAGRPVDDLGAGWNPLDLQDFGSLFHSINMPEQALFVLRGRDWAQQPDVRVIWDHRYTNQPVSVLVHFCFTNFALCNIWLQVVLARRGKILCPHVLMLGWNFSFLGILLQYMSRVAFVFHRSLPFTTFLPALCKLLALDRGVCFRADEVAVLPFDGFPGAVLSVWMQPVSPEAGTSRLIIPLASTYLQFACGFTSLGAACYCFH